MAANAFTFLIAAKAVAIKSLPRVGLPTGPTPARGRWRVLGAAQGAVDAGARGRSGATLRYRGQVDAQAEVAPERGLAVIPTAEHAGLVVVRKPVVQVQREQALQRARSALEVRIKFVVPDRRIVHVAVVGRDVESPSTTSSGCLRNLSAIHCVHRVQPAQFVVVFLGADVPPLTT